MLGSDFFRKRFSYDVGVDLGTANTLVYVKDRGIILNEPSVVALNQKTGRVVAFGTEAKRMLGRTPPHIVAIRPLIDGVVSNFEVTEEMLRYFLRKVKEGKKAVLFGPRVIVGVPYGITNVERRAVMDAARNAGARKVYLVEEPMSAALGVHIPIHEPTGMMIIDIGGGTSEIAVISLSGIVRAKSLKIAGDKLIDDIVGYIREEFKILLGEKTAEDLKVLVGSVSPLKETLEATVRGRDLVTGLPREVVITSEDIREAVNFSVGQIVDAAREVIETTPPELISDIMHHGIMLVGGGALIQGLPALLEKELKIPIRVADEPLTAVVRGMAVIFDDFDNYKDILMETDDDISPRAQ